MSSQSLSRVAPATDQPLHDLEIETLFRRHYRLVYRVLGYWGVPNELLEDACQDVFVVVTRRLGELEEPTRAKSWLVSIARRVASNYRRSSMRTRIRLAIVRRFREAASGETASLEPEHAVLARELLFKLHPEQRVALVLSKLGGWTVPEIAQALELNENTVYGRLRLARAKLAVELDKVRRRSARSQDHD